MATPLFSFTTLNGSDPAGHDSINVLIKSIEDQLASVSSGLSTGADTPGSVTTGQVLRWSGTTYANALVNAASLDTGAVIEAKIASSAVTETKIADSAVTSAKIANDTIVNADINSSAGIVDTKLATISTAGKVANSATTAASANGNNTIVQRDASGNFSADTITASLSGTATRATNIVGGSAGSVPYQTGTSATGMLANGSAGEVLTSNGTTLAPSWQVASIGEANIATNAVTESKIATGAVTSAKIADGTIVAGDISSTYPGHQVLTTTQKNALTGVVTGTMVYDSTLNLVQLWNGTIWKTMPGQLVGHRTTTSTYSSFGGANIFATNITIVTDGSIRFNICVNGYQINLYGSPGTIVDLFLADGSGGQIFQLGKFQNPDTSGNDMIVPIACSRFWVPTSGTYSINVIGYKFDGSALIPSETTLSVYTV
jgi:hypothetical protein